MTRYARAAFALGYADTGPLPMTTRALATRHAIESSPYTGPHLVGVILEAGRTEGNRARREKSHDRLYAFHMAELAALIASILKRLDADELARQMAEHAAQQTQAGATVIQRRHALQGLALGAIAAQVHPDDRAALDSLNAAGWAHATAQGRAEATATPSGGGVPTMAKVAVAAAAALKLIPSEEAQAATAGWTDSEIATVAMGAAIAAGDGAALDDAVRAVKTALVSTTRATRAYADQLHQAVNQAFVATVQQRNATALYRWVVNSGNPCVTCTELSAEGPWRADQLPTLPPLHPNCVIGTTRLVVPGDVEARLTLDPVSVGAIRDGGAPSAATMAEAERDFGRRNIRAVTVREYVGDVVTIVTASGKELTGTPNHPIATPGGWVPLTELHVGDDVLHSTAAEWEPSAIDPHVDHVPPTAQQIAQSFTVSLDPMPTAAEDFHGDGAGSKVHVVRADRLLGHHVVSGDGELFGEPPLCWGNVELARLVRPGAVFALLDRLMTVARRFVGRFGICAPLFRRQSGVPEHLGLAHGANGNTPLQKPLVERRAADAEFFCQDLLTLSSEIATDQVISVRRHPFTGHVYNLDSLAGFYIANGIVTHNCACNLEVTTTTPALAPVGADTTGA